MSTALEEHILYLLLMVCNSREITIFITKDLIQIEQLAFETVYRKHWTAACVYQLNTFLNYILYFLFKVVERFAKQL